MPSRRNSSTHPDFTKLPCEILKSHPERTIISGNKIHLFLEIRGPQWGVITPIPLPLKVPPRVAELKQTVAAEVPYVQDGIGMSSDHPHPSRLLRNLFFII
eukprot:Lithocolla_globosa_v1_NODE_2673_length_1910_cov_6.773585.p3 type:complete len:101 gc:universal NODE_2673_length_1910_cov_6.773585:1295-1597(+)